MKKIFTTIFVITLFSGCAYAFYDFCVMPQDYEFNKEYYDTINDFRKTMPEYEEDNEPVILYEDKSTKKHPKTAKPIPVESDDGVIHIK